MLLQTVNTSFHLQFICHEVWSEGAVKCVSVDPANEREEEEKDLFCRSNRKHVLQSKPFLRWRHSINFFQIPYALLFGIYRFYSIDSVFLGGGGVLLEKLYLWTESNRMRT